VHGHEGTLVVVDAKPSPAIEPVEQVLEAAHMMMRVSSAYWSTGHVAPSARGC
jgi:hypothetical protein